MTQHVQSEDMYITMYRAKGHRERACASNSLLSVNADRETRKQWDGGCSIERERESCYIIWSRSALTCSNTPKGRSGFSDLMHFGKASQSYECRTPLRFTTTCPDKYANAQHIWRAQHDAEAKLTYMHSQITGLQLLVLLEARICNTQFNFPPGKLEGA